MLILSIVRAKIGFIEINSNSNRMGFVHVIKKIHKFLHLLANEDILSWIVASLEEKKSEYKSI